MANSTVGKWVYDRLIERLMTQTDLVKASGLPRAKLSEISQGRDPTVEEMDLIVKGFSKGKQARKGENALRRRSEKQIATAISAKSERRKQFQKRLVFYMKKAGLSSTDLQKKLGLKYLSVISTYMNGRVVPAAKRLQEIADILGVEPEDLFS